IQMQHAAAASGCGLDWSILAGLEKEETDFGRHPGMLAPHDGCIVGLVQMQPGNWALFAPPGGNPFDQHDALSAAAKSCAPTAPPATFVARCSPTTTLIRTSPMSWTGPRSIP